MLDSTHHRRLTRFWLLAFCTVLMTAINGFIIVSLIAERGIELSNARQLTASAARSVEEHAARSIGNIDLTLAGIVEALQLSMRGHNLAELPEADPAISTALKRSLSLLPQVRAFTVLSPAGTVIYDTREPGAMNLDLSDRDYFTAHRDQRLPGCYIGLPMISRIDNKWFFGISRALFTASGVFAGVVTAVVDPSDFGEFYRSLELGTERSASLVHERGIIYVREPGQEAFIETDQSQTPLFSQQLPKSSTGTYQAWSIDGIERIISYRKVPRYPLVVTATVTLNSVLAPWWRGLITAVAVLLLADCALIWVMMLLFRNLYREEQFLQQLRVSESHAIAIQRQLSDAIENMSEGFMLLDRDYRLVLINTRFRKLFGPAGNDLFAGMTYEEILHRVTELNLVVLHDHDPDAYIRTRIEQNRVPGEPVEQRLTSGRWLLARVFATSDGGRVHIRTDITELKQHQIDLEQQALLLRTTVENIAQGLCVFDADQRLVLWNHNWLELLGLPTELGVVGTPLETFVRWRAQRGDYGPIDVDLATDAHVAEIELSGKHVTERQLPNGRTVEVRGIPMPDGGRLTTYSDITEHRHREDELKAASAEAARANQGKSLFLATMSHELRTPLNAIIGFSGIIADRALGRDADALDAYAGFAEDTRRGGQLLLEMVNNILDVSKIESGRMKVMIDRVDLRSVLAACIGMAREEARQREVTIQIDLAPDFPEIRADERAMRQMITNLLSNALKFTGPGGRIDIAGRLTDDGGFTLTVTDTGIGIPPDQIDRVMLPFEQGDNRYSRSVGGTGLGLFLVKGLAELHGGSLTLTSELGVGTRVVLTFPALRLELALAG